ncbi:hypothetical protein MIR68_009321 [Amoeboaphelidium protococcarum]|nr:hypothetical protein MIR68_009321 [Amoeboaphelidium protococcarum]
MDLIYYSSWSFYEAVEAYWNAKSPKHSGLLAEQLESLDASSDGNLSGGVRLAQASQQSPPLIKSTASHRRVTTSLIFQQCKLTRDEIRKIGEAVSRIMEYYYCQQNYIRIQHPLNAISSNILGHPIVW